MAVHRRSRRRPANRSDRLPLCLFLIPDVSSQTRTQRMSLPKHSKYRTIYADPPWPEYGGGKIKPSADPHYPLMSIHAIVPPRATLQHYTHDERGHLYLWVTNPPPLNG